MNRPVEVLLEVHAWLSGDQPGFVRCRLVDRHDRQWQIDEKVPVISSADIEPSELPRFVWIDAVATSAPGSDYVTVELGHHIEANDGTTTFEMPYRSVRDPK